MQPIFVEEINTTLQPMQIYKLFSNRKYSFFLDSAMDPNHLGRYSFIGAEPFLRLSSKGSQTDVWEKGQKTMISGNPFEVLSSYLRKYPLENNTDFPFVGGAVGYLSYDLCRLLEEIPNGAVDDTSFPDMMMGFYNGIILMDHAEQKTYAIAVVLPGDAEETGAACAKKWKEFVESGKSPDESGWDDPYAGNVENLQSNFSEEDFCRAVEKVRNYIREGDIYQANISQCYSTQIRQHPLHIYERLRTINPAPFAAYLDYGTTHILSSSPERFMKVHKGVVETRPIKGTMPRGTHAVEDQENRDILMNSEKDMAENLMIVDLMRNDLGKVCKIGSVRVPELFAIETYPTVFHMVSCVTGERLDTCDAVDCITAAFPGGSITGAPKVRAMEIIEEIEPSRRLIYTGSIGYIGFDGTMDMNIAIRTLLVRGDHATYQVGGGIVWDSVPLQEYRETLDKGSALRKTLLSEDECKIESIAEEDPVELPLGNPSAFHSSKTERKKRMPKSIVYINGRIENESTAVILAKDPGLLSGYGAYDSIRVYQYRPFKLSEHVSRLKDALHKIDIDIPPANTWEEDIDKYLHESELEDGVLRITVTRGIDQANILFTHRPIGYTASMYQDGYTIGTSSIRRNASSPMTYIKSLQLMDGVLAKREAIKAGFHDALFLNTDHQITECSTSNLFFVRGQTLYTPAISCGLLDGIARELIISRIAGELGYNVVEGAFTLEDLFCADEVFMSNSVIQIMPVVRVDEHVIGDGKPGPIVERIAKQYEKHVTQQTLMQ